MQPSTVRSVDTLKHTSTQCMISYHSKKHSHTSYDLQNKPTQLPSKHDTHSRTMYDLLTHRNILPLIALVKIGLPFEFHKNTRFWSLCSAPGSIVFDDLINQLVS